MDKRDYYLESVCDRPELFNTIPVWYKYRKSFIKEAISRNPGVFLYLPYVLKNRASIALHAVKTDGLLLEELPAMRRRDKVRKDVETITEGKEFNYKKVFAGLNIFKYIASAIFLLITPAVSLKLLTLAISGVLYGRKDVGLRQNIILEAVKNNPQAALNIPVDRFYYTNSRLLKKIEDKKIGNIMAQHGLTGINKSFVFRLMEANPEVFDYLPNEIRYNEVLVEEIVKRNPKTAEYIFYEKKDSIGRRKDQGHYNYQPYREPEARGYSGPEYSL